ncbi:lytic transglycosylase domain-containing protein [Actinomadura sp. ATCC 31491]|uniref:Lytic transglycosylase domain-containing protein n=1 Tax=Actinomadura luzonensis TaxID=2805427 RepID=A0ABT0FYZ3_9ACTN|nr:lytic murein transglycosylase [Actinomadura luzonensis]MCK2217568.1 lytic transglycosylase domain-containing protein [Actinomadura luzonensis]
MSGLPSFRAVMLMVIAVVVVTVATGGVVVLLDGDLTGTLTGTGTGTGTGTQDPADRPARRPAQRSTTAPRLDQLVPTAEPASEHVQEFGEGGPGVTVTAPRVLAIAPAQVSKRTRLRLAALKHVEKAVVVDAGQVKVSGTPLNLLAVDPVQFRSWTPQAVADQPAVWSALTRGELVAEAGAARRYGIVPGALYQVDGGPRLRVAASAPLGLTGVDGLVGADLGRAMGFAPGVAVLLHGKPGKISDTAVRKLLGKGTQVAVLDAAARTPKQQTATGRQSTPRNVAVGRPASYLDLYKLSAARCPGLSWTVLAAIGQVESGHGRNNGPSSAGALGPMQFMPATWKHYGVDGDGDGKADIWSPYDAVPAAAGYLCANGAGKGGEKLRKAIWFYNHSWDYVNKVMGIAEGYARAYL